MAPDDRIRDVAPEHPDGLTPAQLRRFELWRAMSALAQAQTDGRLTVEQARLLDAGRASLGPASD